VGEPDAAVELGVAGQAFLDPGHAHEDHAETVSVVVVADLLQLAVRAPERGRQRIEPVAVGPPEVFSGHRPAAGGVLLV